MLAPRRSVSRAALRFDPAELTCGLVGGEWACSTPVRYRAAVHVRARGWCVYAADGPLVIPVDLHTESVPAWTTRDGHVRVWAAAEDRPDLAVAGVWEMLDDAVEFFYLFDEHGYATSPRPER